MQGSIREPIDMANWLIPALTNAESRTSDAPDFYAIGFQEFLPLRLGLLDMSPEYLAQKDSEIRATIARNASIASGIANAAGKGDGTESYTLVARHALAGIALLVYARDRTVAARVREVRTANVGTGVFGVMGNKGAVGIRVVLDGEGEGEKKRPDEVLTFVTAHLAAHDHNVPRRNADWASIVSRLIFEPSSAQLKFSAAGDTSLEKYSIYDTSHLFVFGDLNYRLALGTPPSYPFEPASAATPRALTKKDLLAQLASSSYSPLLPHDQLSQQQRLGLTLHFLSEGDFASFRPTYKYKVGADPAQMSSKRIPGWTDRVLFASWADGEDAGKRKGGTGWTGGEKGSGVTVELYGSVMEYNQSDHKPVTAILSLPSPPLDPSSPSSPATLRLPHAAPFAADPARRTKAQAGKALNVLFGSLWLAIFNAGGGNILVGLAQLAALVVTVWWYLNNAGQGGPLAAGAWEEISGGLRGLLGWA